MEVKNKLKNSWCMVAEIPKNTIFMMGAPTKFFLDEWPKRGLGNFVKEYFTHFKGDFSQMWYRRFEFDKEADFLANKMIKNPIWAIKITDKIEDWSKKFMVEARNFYKIDFNNVSTSKMINSWKKVFRWHLLSHGVGASVSWHADADKERVTKAITKIVETKIMETGDSGSPAVIFSFLSSPKENSFAQKEEREFLEIAKIIAQDKKAARTIKRLNLEDLTEKLKSESPRLFSLLLAHFEKWRWLAYGYKGPAYDFNYFLDRWQILFQQNVIPGDLLKEITVKERKANREQKIIMRRLRFNKYQTSLIKLTQRLVFIKDFRKGALYHGMYCYEPFFSEVGKRLGLTLRQVTAMNWWEIIDSLLGKIVIKKNELDERLIGAVCYYDGQEYKILAGDRARKFFAKISKEKIVTQGINELVGTCASPGFARGMVKIVETTEDMGKMNQGDVLVSETTYPSLVPAMKKASAIVTNAGGLTCHAAIVSRELGIPCVVGTKIANKILKDGDMVEVDATRGRVRIISSNK